MLMQTKSISDRNLLWFTGFMTSDIQPGQVTTQPDIDKICAFFLVTPQTVKRWLKDGLPVKARHQLEMVYAGDFLPPAWRKASLKVCHDGVLLADGQLIRLSTIQFWPFIMKSVSWDKVPRFIANRSL